MRAMLAKKGYDPSVFDDETHAYAGEKVEWLRSKGVNVKHIEPTREKLCALFKEFTGRER
jgi:hypothetical protein